MSGEVPSASSVSVPVTVSFNLIANPYPVATVLADIDVSSFVGDGSENILVFDGAAYVTYTYWPAYGGWKTAGFGDANGISIPVGAGFWLDSAITGSLVFNKNF